MEETIRTEINRILGQMKEGPSVGALKEYALTVEILINSLRILQDIKNNTVLSSPNNYDGFSGT